MIRDRIVVGLKDFKLSEKLQDDSELTLAKAIQQARQTEAVKKQQAFIRDGLGEKKAEGNIDAVHTTEKKTSFQGKSRWYKPERKQPSPQETVRKQTPPTWKNRSPVACRRCGSSAFHNREKCPAIDAICRKCKWRGHYEACCRNTKAIGVVCEENEEDAFFLGEIISDDDSNPWQTVIELNQSEVMFKIDTGADVTVIPEKIFQQLEKRPELIGSRKVLYGPGHNILKLLGTFTGSIQKGDKITEEDVFVIQGAHQALLGRPAIQALNLVLKVDSIEVASVENQCKTRYPNLF